MAEIIPNGKLYLLKNLKIDNTYENTIIFSTPNAQYSYFISKCPNTATYGFTQVNYQRVNKGVIAIKGMAEQIMTCNYMMFQNSLVFQDGNTSTSTTFDWVYAFITDVDYKSTNCCEIHYEIDVLQTFMFRYSLGQCYVDREHTVSDEIGEHIIDEGLPVGDYEYSPVNEKWLDPDTGEYVNHTAFVDYATYENRPTMYIVIACSFDAQYNDAYGEEYNSFFSGLVYHKFPDTPTGRTACKTFIQNASTLATGNKVDEIVAIFYAPRWAMDFLDLQTTTIPYNDHHFDPNDFYGAFHGYTPKNNKLYTYPYNYFYVFDTASGVAEYKIEKFSVSPSTSSSYPGMFKLTEYFDFSCSPCVTLIPQLYEMSAGTNFMEQLTLGPFPQLSWISDSYKAWIAQNGTSLITSGISSALGMGGSAITGVANYNANAAYAGMSRNMGGYNAGMLGAAAGAIGAGVGIALNLFNTVLDTFTAIDYAKRLPDQVHGNINASQLMCVMRQMRFHGYRRFARRDYAESIDNFFTMYGYKCNKIKVPNIDVRKQFTYVKTVNCLLVPNASTGNQELPKTYEKQIIDIYNSGVRIWRNGDNIGRYDLDNSPLTQGA